MLHVFQYWNIVLVLVDICTAVNDTKPENLNLKKQKRNKKRNKKERIYIVFSRNFCKRKKDRRRFYSFHSVEICEILSHLRKFSIKPKMENLSNLNYKIKFLGIKYFILRPIIFMENEATL